MKLTTTITLALAALVFPLCAQDLNPAIQWTVTGLSNPGIMASDGTYTWVATYNPSGVTLFDSLGNNAGTMPLATSDPFVSMVWNPGSSTMWVAAGGSTNVVYRVPQLAVLRNQPLGVKSFSPSPATSGVIGLDFQNLQVWTGTTQSSVGIYNMGDFSSAGTLALPIAGIPQDLPTQATAMVFGGTLPYNIPGVSGPGMFVTVLGTQSVGSLLFYAVAPNPPGWTFNSWANGDPTVMTGPMIWNGAAGTPYFAGFGSSGPAVLFWDALGDPRSVTLTDPYENSHNATSHALSLTGLAYKANVLVAVGQFSAGSIAPQVYFAVAGHMGGIPNILTVPGLTVPGAVYATMNGSLAVVSSPSLGTITAMSY